MLSGPDWYDYDVVYPDVVCNVADARLISAAPDLYEACKEFLAHFNDGDLSHEQCAVWDDILRAVRKADGQ